MVIPFFLLEGEEKEINVNRFNMPANKKFLQTLNLNANNKNQSYELYSNIKN